jgi:hypothetical protein
MMSEVWLRQRGEKYESKIVGQREKKGKERNVKIKAKYEDQKNNKKSKEIKALTDRQKDRYKQEKTLYRT